MSTNLFFSALLFSVGFFCIFYLTELLHKKVHLSQETTRKVAHIGAGSLSLLFPFYIESTSFIIGYTLSFALFFFVAKRKYFFPSITNPNRKTYGSWFFPLAILMSYLAFKLFEHLNYYLVPMTLLTFSDSIAALVGRTLPIKKYHLFRQTKSIGGSISFFLTSFLILTTLTNAPISIVIGFALCITVIEALSFYGLDNITIPAAAIILLHLVIS